MGGIELRGAGAVILIKIEVRFRAFEVKLTKVKVCLQVDEGSRIATLSAVLYIDHSGRNKVS